MRGRAISLIMREIASFRLLARIVSLAMMGLALTVGSALAHGGPAAVHDQAVTQVQAPDMKRQPGGESSMTDTSDSIAAMQANDADHAADQGGMPCSGNPHGAGSASGSCCTIACHAALATPYIEPLGALEPPSVRVVGLADMLEGRSSDRTERPPKLG
jgi:hypothetical protein